MSRIGKLPVPVPSGVDVQVQSNTITVKGPKGTLSHVVVEPLTIQLKFGLCRVCLREMAHRGELPGVTKSSW